MNPSPKLAQLLAEDAGFPCNKAAVLWPTIHMPSERILVHSACTDTKYVQSYVILDTRKGRTGASDTNGHDSKRSGHDPPGRVSKPKRIVKEMQNVPDFGYLFFCPGDGLQLVRNISTGTHEPIYLITYLLHAAQSFLRS